MDSGVYVKTEPLDMIAVSVDEQVDVSKLRLHIPHSANVGYKTGVIEPAQTTVSLVKCEVDENELSKLLKQESSCILMNEAVVMNADGEEGFHWDNRDEDDFFVEDSVEEIVRVSNEEDRVSVETSPSKFTVSKRKLRKLAPISYQECDEVEKFIMDDEFESSEKEPESTTTKTGPTLFECEVCQQSFPLKSSLAKHKSILKHKSLGLVSSEHKSTLDNKQTYECSFCHKSFTSIEETRDHVRSTHLNQFECKLCTKTFKHESLLLQHINTVHDDDVTLWEEAKPSVVLNEDENKTMALGRVEVTCSLADGNVMALTPLRTSADGSATEDDVLKQNSINEEGRAFECSFCHDSFLSKEEAREHIKSVHLKLYQCDVCQKNFKLEKALIAHMESIHGKLISGLENTSIPVHKPKKKREKKVQTQEPVTPAKQKLKKRQYQCQLCGKTFSEGQQRKSHYMAVHWMKKPSSCHLCNKTLSSKDGLKDHIKTVHLKARPYQCDVCNKYFAERGGMRNHKLRVHEKLKPFKCDICNLSYFSLSYLKIHKKCVHFKMKLYKCQDCDEAFCKSVELRDHKLLAHDKARHYNCPFCNRPFRTSKDMYRHKSKVHLNSKPLKCEICSKSFGSSRYYKIHKLSVHENKKPFKCDVCDALFTRKDHMKVHKKTVHEKVREHKCEICNAYFGTFSNLNYHRAHKHHNIS